MTKMSVASLVPSSAGNVRLRLRHQLPSNHDQPALIDREKESCLKGETLSGKPFIDNNRCGRAQASRRFRCARADKWLAANLDHHGQSMASDCSSEWTIVRSIRTMAIRRGSESCCCCCRCWPSPRLPPRPQSNWEKLRLPIAHWF